jgi:hypothetical protein
LFGRNRHFGLFRAEVENTDKNRGVVYGSCQLLRLSFFRGLTNNKGACRIGVEDADRSGAATPAWQGAWGRGGIEVRRSLSRLFTGVQVLENSFSSSLREARPRFAAYREGIYAAVACACCLEPGCGVGGL